MKTKIMQQYGINSHNSKSSFSNNSKTSQIKFKLKMINNSNKMHISCINRLLRKSLQVRGTRSSMNYLNYEINNSSTRYLNIKLD